MVRSHPKYDSLTVNPYVIRVPLCHNSPKLHHVRPAYLRRDERAPATSYLQSLVNKSRPYYATDLTHVLPSLVLHGLENLANGTCWDTHENHQLRGDRFLWQ